MAVTTKMHGSAREGYDFFFGPVWHHKDPPFTRAGFENTVREIADYVTPFVFTKHLRRAAKVYGRFQLFEPYETAPLEHLIAMIDADQVDLVKAFTWQGSQKCLGLELVFPESSVEIQGVWPLENKMDFDKLFWSPFVASRLSPKAVLQDGDVIRRLHPHSLAGAVPAPFRLHGEQGGEA